jgi:hypothetical protein
VTDEMIDTHLRFLVTRSLQFYQIVFKLVLHHWILLFGPNILNTHILGINLT